MAATILMITDAREAERLGRTLHRIWGKDLRLVTDLFGLASPDEQLLHYRPQVLLLGTGQLGIPVTAYLEAARRHCPDCTVVLICDRRLLVQAQRLSPDRILVRPLTGAAVQGVLAELSKRTCDLEVERKALTSGMRSLPAIGPVLPKAVAEAGLSRIDDVFADPLSSLPRVAPVLPRVVSPLRLVEPPGEAEAVTELKRNWGR